MDSDPDQELACTSCTFVNSPELNECEMCGSALHASAEDSYSSNEILENFNVKSPAEAGTKCNVVSLYFSFMNPSVAKIVGDPLLAQFVLQIQGMFFFLRCIIMLNNVIIINNNNNNKIIIK